MRSSITSTNRETIVVSIVMMETTKVIISYVLIMAYLQINDKSEHCRPPFVVLFLGCIIPHNDIHIQAQKILPQIVRFYKDRFLVRFINIFPIFMFNFLPSCVRMESERDVMNGCSVR